ncbi:ATP/GTP-binding protein [Streptomyces kasugaensis]|uniref:ATP/GTP-binding protein n=2 Tax=Streptomyces kasugaensis TaxID=1946 RepID=A0A4V2JIR1_STRKA|nr:ATP/GTP-binding protein [Streptomyces kasugaensis]
MANTAIADDAPPVTACEASYVCLSAKDPGSAGQPASGASNRAVKKAGKESPPELCTVRRLDPQPPADSPVWNGHSPSDGGIYIRSCPWEAASQAVGAGAAGAGQPFWSASPPPGKAVDPAVLAQEAVDKMKLTGPDIGIVPKPGGTGLVGLPVWMWTAKTPEAYGPNTASATAGAVTVTANAQVSQILWDMGDGHTITCTTAGTPYQTSYGKRRSPDCGYLYQHSSKDEPGQKYTVTATSTWTVDWNGGGQSGQLTQTRQSQTQITIGQLKVLN